MKVFYKQKSHTNVYDLVFSCCSYFVFRWRQIISLIFKGIASGSVFSHPDVAWLESWKVKGLRDHSSVWFCCLPLQRGKQSLEALAERAPYGSDGPHCHTQMSPCHHPGTLDCTDGSPALNMSVVHVALRRCKLGPPLARNVSGFRGQAILHVRWCSGRGLLQCWSHNN